MNKIAGIRAERSLTQHELANQIGVSRRTLIRWEKGDVRPRPYHLAALARALGCDVGELETVDSLTDARRAVGLSQRAFAEQANIPAGSLAAIETGRAPVPDPTMWARILGRTTVEIDRLADRAIEARYRILLDRRR